MSVEVVNFESKKDDRQNLKIKYKNQRLQQAKEVYLCECQKNYLSFPALYLHVKNKHKIKLTTKITDKICKMEQKNGKTYITYFLKNSEDDQGNKIEEINSDQLKKSSKNDGMKTCYDEEFEKGYLKSVQQNLQDKKTFEKNQTFASENRPKLIIEEFLRSLSYPNLHSYQISSTTMTFFLNYIQKFFINSKQFEIFNKQQLDKLISLFPMYFNDFICCYLPMVLNDSKPFPIDIKTTIQVFKIFGKWLREKNYTKLIVIESK